MSEGPPRLRRVPPAEGGSGTARVVALAGALAAALGAGCEGSGPVVRRAGSERAPPPPGAHVEELPAEPADEAVEAPPPIAEPPDAPEPGAASARAAATGEPAPAPAIERAAATDGAYDSDEPEAVRRYVYRVRMVVPEALGVNHSDLAIPAAELFVDVSAERLRARFVGPGWPVEAGSEVRVRGDSPGAYVFDRDGGRALAPGAMSAWFEGGPRNRAGPPLSIRREPQRRSAPPSDAPGGLICALLAEWSGDARDSVVRRCDGAAPIAFRVGLWRAERTADVPVELPRRALRADEVGPPPPIPRTPSRAFLEPAALARIPPMEQPPRDVEPSPGAPGEGLEFVNESDARVVVTVEGVAVGWVDAGASGLFVGLVPGAYRVGAIRPMGAVVIRPRVVPVPGRTVLRPPRRARDGDPPPG